MIVVFAEFGGERQLGKAREIADSLGVKVIAVCSAESGTETFTQRLISLGADGVIKFNHPKNVFEWSEVLSSILNGQTRVRLLLATSGLFTDAILGRVYALSKDRVESFASGIDSLSENEATKGLRSWGASLRFKLTGEVCIFSLKAASNPMPFEDSMRYGKTTQKDVLPKPGKFSPSTADVNPEEYIGSSGILTLLVGKNLARKGAELKQVQRIASKYKGKVVEQNSKVEEIYGPCLAIDFEGWQESELPTFHGELIAIASSRNQIITRVADTSSITSELPKVLEKL